MFIADIKRLTMLTCSLTLKRNVSYPVTEASNCYELSTTASLHGTETSKLLYEINGKNQPKDSRHTTEVS